MKKIIFLFLFNSILLFPTLYSQNPPPRDYIQEGFDQVLSNLNLAYVNTGYLYDKTYHITKLSRFNGVREIRIDKPN